MFRSGVQTQQEKCISLEQKMDAFAKQMDDLSSYAPIKNRRSGKKTKENVQLYKNYTNKKLREKREKMWKMHLRNKNKKSIENSRNIERQNKKEPIGSELDYEWYPDSYQDTNSEYVCECYLYMNGNFCYECQKELGFLNSEEDDGEFSEDYYGFIW